MPIFSFKPNWRSPFTDRLEWMTNVIPTRNGREQRIQVREIPRRSFDFDILAARNEFQYLDSLLAAYQSKKITVPFWPDRGAVRANVPSGSDTISVDTRLRDYQVGGRAVIGTGTFDCEEITILAMTDDSIKASSGVLKSWPSGSFIAPARECQFIGESATAVRQTANVSTMRVQFEVVDVTPVAPAFDGAYLYDGTEVCVRRPNRAEDVTVEYRRLQDELDFGTGLREIADLANRPFNVRRYAYLLKNREAIAAYRAWLHERCGRLKPFWSPVWERNFEIVAAQNGLSDITVLNGGFEAMLQALPGRTDIAMRHKDGTWFFRGIVGASGVPGRPDRERITLDAPIGVATSPSDWALCGFLELVTLNADAVEITYMSDSVATSSVSTRSVSQ